jgi:hypothetical protein
MLRMNLFTYRDLNTWLDNPFGTGVARAQLFPSLPPTANGHMDCRSRLQYYS